MMLPQSELLRVKSFSEYNTYIYIYIYIYFFFKFIYIFFLITCIANEMNQIRGMVELWTLHRH